MYLSMMNMRMGETQKAERHTLFVEKHGPIHHCELVAIAYEWVTTSGSSYDRDGIVEMRLAGGAFHEGLVLPLERAQEIAGEHLTADQLRSVLDVLGDVGERYSREVSQRVWLIVPRPIGAEGDRLRQVMHMAAAVWRIVDAAVEGFLARNPGWEPTKKNSWE